MKLKITVTHQNIKDAKDCSIANGKPPSSNCAIAVAVRGIFPSALVSREYIYPLIRGGTSIKLPWQAVNFIATFDRASPSDRLSLPELTFEVDLPQEVIEAISLVDLEKADNLQLV